MELPTDQHVINSVTILIVGDALKQHKYKGLASKQYGAKTDQNEGTITESPVQNIQQAERKLKAEERDNPLKTKKIRKF